MLSLRKLLLLSQMVFVSTLRTPSRGCHFSKLVFGCFFVFESTFADIRGFFLFLRCADLVWTTATLEPWVCFYVRAWLKVLCFRANIRNARTYHAHLVNKNQVFMPKGRLEVL